MPKNFKSNKIFRQNSSQNEWNRLFSILKLIFLIQTYSKFVEIGRVAYIAIGPEQGKLCVIVDVIDQNRVKMNKNTNKDKLYYLC